PADTGSGRRSGSGALPGRTVPPDARSTATTAGRRTAAAWPTPAPSAIRRTSRARRGDRSWPRTRRARPPGLQGCSWLRTALGSTRLMAHRSGLLVGQSPDVARQHADLLRTQARAVFGHVAVLAVVDHGDDGGFAPAVQPHLVGEVG